MREPQRASRRRKALISQGSQEEASIEYPKREKYYAHRLTRLLFKSCAAQYIGQDAVLLVIHIAHAEDAAFYQGPVRFWNSQLNEAMGFRSPKSLNNARSKAVEAGWLVYSRKNDRADGVYFTTIPRHVLRLWSDRSESIPSTESVPSTEQVWEQEMEQKTAIHSKYGTQTGTGSGTETGTPPIPITLNPKNPKKKEALALSSESFYVELGSWVDWWNGLHVRRMVHAGTRISEANTKALRKAKSNSELDSLLADRSKLETEIQASDFVRGANWFTLAKLLSGKNTAGEFIVQRLLEGGYRSGKTKPTYTAGANYDPTKEAGNGRF